MVPITIWATTVMVKNETISINISMKLKSIFSNSNIPHWGIGGNTPTSQKFTRSASTWNNFFPHQTLVPSPLNKNFHVINQ